MKGKPITSAEHLLALYASKKAVYAGNMPRHLPASHVAHWQFNVVMQLIKEGKLFEVTQTPKKKNNYASRVTPENIQSLKESEIFVFGSNLAGRHGAGAARLAYEKFGAKMGSGVGYTGQCYAIPTKDKNIETMRLHEIKAYVDHFIATASERPEETFLVTAIGCGLAGYTPEEIAPLFKEAIPVYNIHLPRIFWDILLKE